MRICKDCKKELPDDSFRLEKVVRMNKKGEIKEYIYRRSSCITCHSQQNERNKNKRRKEILKYHSNYNKSYYQANRDKMIERARIYRQKQKQ